MKMKIILMKQIIKKEKLSTIMKQLKILMIE